PAPVRRARIRIGVGSRFLVPPGRRPLIFTLFPYTPLFRSMGGAQPLAATMAGASMLAVECQPSRIEMRLRTGYLDRQAATLDERSEEHTSELQSRREIVCRPLREKKKRQIVTICFLLLRRG